MRSYSLTILFAISLLVIISYVVFAISGITIISPTNTTYNLPDSNSSYGISISFNVSNATGCIREVDGANTTSCANTTTDFGIGDHYVKIWTNDTLNNTNFEIVRFNVKDITPPNISLISPSNGSNFTTNSIIFNCTATDNVQVNNITLYGNWSSGWHANTTFGAGSLVLNRIIPNGYYSWNCRSNDSSGNIAFASSNNTFFVNASIPGITVSSPTNTTYNLPASNSSYGISISFNVSSANNISSCIREVDGSNTTSCANTTIDFNIGNHYVKIWANDTSNNTNSEIVRFDVKDITPPTVSLILPSNSTNFTTNNITFNCTVTDNVQVNNVMLYGNWSSGWHINATFGTMNVALNRIIPNGYYSWNCRSNDSSGNIAFASSNNTFFVNASLPGITISAPSNTTYNLPASNSSYGVSISFNVSSANNISSCIREVDGSNTTSCANITIDFSVGDHYVKIWANDTSNNMNSNSINFVVKDITGPAITITEPTNTTYLIPEGNSTYNLTPNIYVYDVVLGYQCNFFIDGIMRYSTTGYNITCDYHQAPSFGIGDHNITVVSTDWFGNTNSQTIRFNVKDVTAPNVTLIFPENGSSKTSSVNFNCSFADNVNITNVTLYGNWSSGWHANDTAIINSSINSTNFSKTLTQGYYIWNCLARDASNNINFSASNGTFNVDTTPPSITSFTLSPSSVSVGGTITGTCTATDNFDSSVTTAVTGIDTSSAGTFSATCTATDDAGNSATSTASYTVTASGGGSSGRSSNSGTTTTEKPLVETHIWNLVEAGESVELNITNNMGINKVTIEASQDISSLTVIVQHIESKPVNVEAPSANVYYYFSINTSSINTTNIKNASIEFSVNKSWIVNNNYDKNTVVLLRYNSATKLWQNLSTIIVSEDVNVINYKAEVPGFSYFSIVSQKKTETTTTLNTVNDTLTQTLNNSGNMSGNNPISTINNTSQDYNYIIIVVIVIVIIVGMIYYFRRRSKTETDINYSTVVKETQNNA